MNKRWILGAAALLLLSAVGTACGSKDEEASQMNVTTTTSGQTKVEEVGVKQAVGKPGLDANIKLEGKTATITYKVSNMRIAADHVDHAPVQGEGHLHIYVDGKQKAVLKTDAAVKLENLSTGKHTIKLNLQQNDHTSLDVEKVFEIDVK
ncbi:hypothetical protein D3C73_451090 [compost metagenome]